MPACFFVDDSPVPADSRDLPIMALVGCQALAVVGGGGGRAMVVPVDKRRPPLACPLFAGSRANLEIRPVFHVSEQRFGVRVVAADSPLRDRLQHPQFLKPAFQSDCTHGVAVIRPATIWFRGSAKQVDRFGGVSAECGCHAQGTGSCLLPSPLNRSRCTCSNDELAAARR
jgi:hypothetical protein